MRGLPTGRTIIAWAPWVTFMMLIPAFTVLILYLAGCAQAPQRTRPKGFPYPTRLGPQLPSGVAPMEQVRCLGTGLCYPMPGAR